MLNEVRRIRHEMWLTIKFLIIINKLYHNFLFSGRFYALGVFFYPLSSDENNKTVINI